uniref:ABC transporter ATP-binding protein n=1 Tax=Steinernema glaseri TaxID=37863 RepID=A0A1I7Y2S6_9BILA
GRAQAGVMGEMADGLVGQVMAFVEHVDGVARVGQHGAAAQGQGLWPAVAVAVPFVAGQLLDHAGEQLLTGLVHLDAKALLLEQLRGGGLGVAFLQQQVELGQAQVATTPLGQGEAEVQAAVAHQVRQVLEHDLFLQGHGGGGDHQALA